LRENEAMLKRCLGDRDLPTDFLLAVALALFRSLAYSYESNIKIIN